jgi:hypothetical protein
VFMQQWVVLGHILHSLLWMISLKNYA